MTNVPVVTLVVVPREQFSKTRTALESIYANTVVPFRLVYVDGASPPRVRRYLREQARRRAFTLLRVERFLPGNEARNLALPYVETPYVVFLDNDVMVLPGWLEHLLACARETDAWAVGPLYLLGDPERRIIHTLGGELAIVERTDGRRFRERHRFADARLDDVEGQLARAPIDLIEFHCLLTRTDVLQRMGGLDPALLSFLDHLDFCLAIARAGGKVYSEPSARVTHLAPPPLALSDLRFYLLRWSERWITSSIEHFARTWSLLPADAGFASHREYQRSRRRRVLRGSRHFERLFGRDRYRALEDRINAAIDRVLVHA